MITEIFGVAKGLFWLLSIVSFGGIIIAMNYSLDLAPNKMSLITYILAGLGAIGICHALGYGIIFVATERMEFNAIGSVIYRLLGLALVFLAIQYDQGLNGVLGSMMVSSYLLWGFYWWVFKKRHGLVPLVFKTHKLLNMLKQILLVGSISIVRRLSWNIDILLLPLLKTVSAAGIFNGAYSFIISINMIPTIGSLAFFPMLSRMAKKNPGSMVLLAQRFLFRFMLFAPPIVLVGYILADPLITVLLGKHYAPSVVVMKVLVWDLLLSFPILVLFHFFLALDRQKEYLIAVSLGLGLHFIFDLILIPTHGPVGAAFGNLAADSVCLGWLIISLNRLNVENRKTAVKT
jgi:O-antigen/teichoic acid export membrane protein